MSQSVYSDPRYLLSNGSVEIGVNLNEQTLHLINSIIDELLYITIHHAILLSPDNTNVITIEKFKSSFINILGGGGGGGGGGGMKLGKESLLQGELGLRELSKLDPNLKNDPVLQSNGIGISISPSEDDSRNHQVEVGEEIFSSLRESIMRISGLGVLCRPSGPTNLTTHLTRIISLRHHQDQFPVNVSSRRISFLLVLYIERTLSNLTTSLLQSLRSVLVERRHTSESRSIATAANVQDLEIALKENQQFWSWIKQMKIIKIIQEQAIVLAATAKTKKNSSGGRPGTGNGLGFLRRGSIESNKSSNIIIAPHKRKPSLALTTSTTTLGSSSSPDVDRGGGGNESLFFDQLLNSGQTRKLSITPDRLRLIELEKEKEKQQQQAARELNPLSPPPPTTTTMKRNDSITSSNGRTSSSSRKKLEARNPLQRDLDLFNEEEEEEEEVQSTASLINLLKSPPPWSSSSSSASMEPQLSTTTTTSGDDEASSWVNISPQQQQPRRGGGGGVLKAKDEKRDLASERQINHDLVDLFKDSPPPRSPLKGGLPSSLPLVTTTTTNGSKKSKGFRGFMNKVVNNNNRRPSSTSSSFQNTPPFNPFMSPPDSIVPPNTTMTETITRPGRMRTFSAQSNLSFGSTTTTTTTTTTNTNYALPPGLGETPEKEKIKRERRERKREPVEIQANRGGGERLQLGRRQSKSPAVVNSFSSASPTSPSISSSTGGGGGGGPVSILKTSSNPVKKETTTTSSVPPPVPLLVPRHRNTVSSTSNSTSSSSISTVIVNTKRSSSAEENTIVGLGLPLNNLLPPPQNGGNSLSSSSRYSIVPPPIKLPNRSSGGGLPIPPPSSSSSSPDLDLDSSNVSTPIEIQRQEKKRRRMSPTSFSEEEEEEEEEDDYEDERDGDETTEETDHQEINNVMITQVPSSSSPVKLRQLLLKVDPSNTSSRRNSLGGGGGGGGTSSSSVVNKELSPPRDLSPMTTTTTTGLGLKGIDEQPVINHSREEFVKKEDEEVELELLKNLKSRIYEECKTRRDCLLLIEHLILDHQQYQRQGAGEGIVSEKERKEVGGEENKIVELLLEA